MNEKERNQVLEFLSLVKTEIIVSIMIYLFVGISVIFSHGNKIRLEEIIYSRWSYFPMVLILFLVFIIWQKYIITRYMKAGKFKERLKEVKEKNKTDGVIMIRKHPCLKQNTVKYKRTLFIVGPQKWSQDSINIELEAIIDDVDDEIRVSLGKICYNAWRWLVEKSAKWKISFGEKAKINE